MLDKSTEANGISGNKRLIHVYSAVEEVGKHWISILLLTLAAWILAFVLLSWRQQGSYTSSATIAVTNVNYSTNRDTNQMLTYNSDVLTKLQTALESDDFKKAAAADLGYSRFTGSVSTEIIDKSNLIRISVKSGKPDISYMEVKALLNNYERFKDSLAGGTYYTVLEYPVLQENPSLLAGGVKKSGIVAIAVCMLICMILFCISFGKDTVCDGVDVVEKTGAQFLGAIYRNKKHKAGKTGPDPLITDPSADLVYTEEIRKLADRIGRRMAEKDQKVLLITSAGSGEGKSAAAANIAAAWGQQGKKVTLLSPDHIDREALKRTVADLLRTSDYVIIDTAPADRSSDAMEAAAVADTSVLIVRRGRTCTSQIGKAISDLGGTEKILGCVVSDVLKYDAGVSVTECSRLAGSDSCKHLVDRGKTNEVVINLFPLFRELLRELRRYCIVFLAVVLLFGGLFYFAGRRNQSIKYTAYTTFTVKPLDVVKYNYLNTKNTTVALMGKMVPPILTSDAMKSIIKEDLGYAGSDKLTAQITSSCANNTNLIKVTVSDKDPQTAYDVLQSLLRTGPEILNAALGTVDIEVMDESGLPTEGIVTGNSKKMAVTGALLGVVFCLLFLVIRLVRKDAVLTEDEIAWKLKAERCGRIPWIASKKSGGIFSIESEQVPASFAESVRSIRLRIERDAQDSGARTYLVTSSVKSEGKTTTAVNVAMALAGQGHKVLLVDGNLRNPGVTAALGMDSPQKGLADLLVGNCTLVQALISYKGKADFVILPAGKAVDDPYILWSRDSAGKLLKELSSQFDYVIIDAPQSAVASEMARLAEYSDVCVYVIRQNSAGFNEICEGVETFEESDCRFLGFVMRS